MLGVKIVQEATIQYEVEEECTCNDEYTTIFCPVHPPEVTPSKDIEYGEDDVLIITDVDMSEMGYGFFEGCIFTCPSCGLDAIMVNPSMGKSFTIVEEKLKLGHEQLQLKFGA